MKNSGGTLLMDQIAQVETFTEDKKNRVRWNYEEKIVGKRDKISEMTLKNEVVLFSKNGRESRYEKTNVNAKIDYDFDEDGYSDIETKDPGNTSGISVGGTVGITVNVGGLTSEQYVDTSGSNDWSFSTLTKNFRRGGYLVEWYTDEAYTDPFVPNDISKKEFRNLDVVYGKIASVNDGYAVCAIDYELDDKRSESYKIVFGKKTPTYNGKEELLVIKLATTTEYTFLPLDDYVHEIYVDGVKQAAGATGISLEDQKTYLVEYREIVSDEDFSIFDIKDYFT